MHRGFGLSEAQDVAYEALLGALPGGGLVGNDQPEFGIAARPGMFIEPTLTVVEADSSAGVTLISARGATGKSILSEALAADKQVPLWRLNRDKTVSADALESRLSRYLGPVDPLGSFAAVPSAFIVVDALDEARMRVSGTSWTEFIDSVATAASTGHRFVMLGRERVLEDLWLEFGEAGVGVQWYEISHFDAAQRRRYIDARVLSHREVLNSAYVSARDTVIEALAGTVDVDYSDAFVGYAPVLDAVAALLAKGNLLAIENAFASGSATSSQIAVLTDVLVSLLTREQDKTGPLADELQLDGRELYTPDEQIDWLLSELVGLEPPSLDWCPDQWRGDYVSHVSEFLRDHPFRSETRWASPVFSAFVSSRRFDHSRLQRTLLETGAETGLLFEFVSNEASGSLVLDEWQFAALHSSLLAAEWREAEAVVAVSAPVGEHAPEAIQQADGELVLLEGGRADRSVRVELILERPGELVIRGPAAAISVDFPAVVIMESQRGSLTLGPDCFVHCGELVLRGESVEISRRSDSDGGAESSAVILEVEDAFGPEGTLSGSPPLSSLELRVPAEVAVVYPWVNYRADLEPASAPPNDRSVRLLKMLMNLARSHGHKGGMAVFNKKLEGRQSVKGEEFAAAIAVLEGEGIVSTRGAMIFLTDSAESRRFSGKTKEGLSTLEDNLDDWRPVLDKVAGVLRW
jgi:hypothetical protein